MASCQKTKSFLKRAKTSKRVFPTKKVTNFVEKVKLICTPRDWANFGEGGFAFWGFWLRFRQKKTTIMWRRVWWWWRFFYFFCDGIYKVALFFGLILQEALKVLYEHPYQYSFDFLSNIYVPCAKIYSKLNIESGYVALLGGAGLRRQKKWIYPFKPIYRFVVLVLLTLL